MSRGSRMDELKERYPEVAADDSFWSIVQRTYLRLARGKPGRPSHDHAARRARHDAAVATIRVRGVRATKARIAAEIDVTDGTLREWYRCPDCLLSAEE